MTHTFFALSAGIVCGVMGVRYASMLKKDAARLRRWDELLACLSQLLSESVYSLPDAFALAAREQTPCDLLLLRLSKAIAKQPLASLPQVFDSLGYQEEEADILRRMMERVGHGSMETRCACVRQSGEEIRLLYQHAQRTSDKDAKMWSSLGWTAGACITLLLL